MAKTKEEKNAVAEKTEVMEATAKVESTTKEKSVNEVQNGPSYEDLLKLVNSLASEVSALKNAKVASNSDNTTDKILEMLSNKKSDREVTIVHNREMLHGLSTAIDLTGLSIRFHAMGERRTLSWQQFEECVSKYRRFFERQVILLGDEHADLAERYSVPCVKRGSNHVFTRTELAKLNQMDPHELEDFFNSLTKQDREFVCSYWLGKCYEKADGFYDRYKVELLNRLNGGHVFDNLLTLMNGDFRNE